MRQQKSIFDNIDWTTVLIYLALVIFGWINIYAAVYDERFQSIFDTTQRYGKQMLWIVLAIIISLAILVVDGKFYEAFAYYIYGFFMLALLLVLLIARDVKGAVSWIDIGSFKLQPSEFTKFGTCLALAKFLSEPYTRMTENKTKIIAALICLVPMALILMQNDTGSAMVYASFIFVMYRAGLSQNFLIIGFITILIFVLALMIPKLVLVGVIIGVSALGALFLRRTMKNILMLAFIAIVGCAMVYGVDYVFNEVLQTHQRERIEVLLGKRADPKGAGYNVNQSLIAIGSGGLTGKGFLQGTQTKYDFVPEQATDFIFCTVGEEWGFIGTTILMAMFLWLLIRIVMIAERQKNNFVRMYGYGVASIIFFHIFINIGMTIGLLPVIGIPLPFFSYGGSSLWSFTILLFILIKLDSYRMFVLR
ncbi:MAG TPA: rod shape-determining protein RodA [Bacteroidia bacterium]|nr:rod shape-determining protein RodA [Bacteroidia bacterium]